MREQGANGHVDRAASNPAWPLAVPFVGLPIWWLLGVWQLMFFLVSIVMAFYLVKQRRSIAIPRGFWIWLLWLTWLLTGLLVLQVNAPGTIPEINMNRYLVFAYRYGWYLIAAVVALYIVNTRGALSTKKIVEAVSWFFVVLVGGGLLGLFAPAISFDSVLQSLLPHGLASNPMVNELTHVQTAQIHTLLGGEQVRPSAPFIHTNSWGFALAVTLPLFVISWWNRRGAWRVAMIAVLLAATLPLVSSLNRGTWVAVSASLLFAVLRSAVRGNLKALAVSGVGGGAAVLVLVISPWGGLVLDRLADGHSDQVRENLSTMAVQSTIEGSPVVGFGTTRNVLGNFSSIAGGASEVCPNCEPPPVGTHGQVWLATFGAGLVGTAIYVSFLLTQFFGNLRSQSPYAGAALASILTMIVTLPIYNGTGIALFIGFIAIGILARESEYPLPTLHDTAGLIAKGAHVVVLCVAVGAASGHWLTFARGVPVAATQRLYVPSAEFAPVPGIRQSTLDTEAMLVRSPPVLESVAQELSVRPREALSRLSIGAESNTRILLITFQSLDAEHAERGVSAATTAFLNERERYLAELGAEVTERQRTQQEDLDAIYQRTRLLAQQGSGQYLWGTMAALSSRWQTASETLADVGSRRSAQAIATPSVRPLNDVRTIRIASGVGLGGLVGLLLAFISERRLRKLGNLPHADGTAAIPVVARCGESSLRRAVKVANGYTPLAGILAGPGSTAATEFAARVDRAITDVAYSGKRILLVVEPGMSRYRTQQAIQWWLAKGLDPVGLILYRSGDTRTSKKGGAA
ncbi:MAG TPA: hypothetical protein VK098_05650 [Beutenbergiaceae bacterium]|nr:hypothetical protein [Beutenbergiaceae bacterium]